jgi:glycosyltransferase involved in cell wall biosynthesis
MVRVLREPPSVGIVTPTLDMGHFLREAIDSVLAQDYPRIDYLVMDGGSRDGTRELLESYGDRLRFVSAPDGGQAAAVNRGLGRVSGEIVCFLNADDAYLPGAVSAAVAAFESEPAAAVAYGEADFVDEHGAPIGPYPTRDFGLQALAEECFVCQPAAFVSRAAFERCGGLDERLSFALDYDLWIRLAQQAPFVRLRRTLARARMHSDNKTLGERGPSYREAMAVVKRHFGYVPARWVDAYAVWLADRGDGLEAPGRHPLRTQLLCLGLGLGYNRLHPLRWLSDWSSLVGLAGDFHGLWVDSWMSTAHARELDVPADAERLRVRGRHEARRMRAPLGIELSLDGRRLAWTALDERGPFELSAAVPEGLRGRRGRLLLEADRTWVPLRGGDLRRLSCLIDAIELD